MKLFLREHVPLVVMVVIQLVTVLFVIWIAGYRELTIIFYAFFLGFCFLIGYLVYRYVSHKEFYERLSTPLKHLEESYQAFGNAPLPNALKQLLKMQYAQYIEQLHQVNQKRNNHLTFINQWVHQMKTPLSVIELLVQEEEDERFVSIREEADKIGKGLDLVLYAARLEAFQHDFQVQRVNLKEVAMKAIHENKRFLIRNKVYPEIHIPSDCYVESDEKWLTFIMNQLITNAAKYSAGKSEKIVIVGNENCIEVRDQGIGIPKSDIRRVFEPFYTGENGRKYRESTGMGLYLVKEVCEKLGHRVDIESEVGAGTTVRITFASPRGNLTKM